MSAARRFLPLVGDVTANCLSCSFREECGGLDDQQLLWGCMVRCGVTCGGPSVCDYTCPTKPHEFQRRWGEVDGMSRGARVPLRSPALEPLPKYIPLLQHASSRCELLDLPVVALSTRDVLRSDRRTKRYAPLDTTDTALRTRYRLGPATRVLLVSVATDEHLERYWERQQIDSVPAALAALRPYGMTVPNFSFFSCAPRFHTMWNRSRMMRSAELLVSAGVPIVPHLNAETQADWDGWYGLLRDHPNVEFVAKEFGTGLVQPSAAFAALNKLASLEQRLGRPLHFLLIAARRFAPEIKTLMARFSIIDSKPFEAALHRKAAVFRAGLSLHWESAPTAHGASVDALLRANISNYAAWVASAKPRAIPPNDADAQLSFDWRKAARREV